VTGRANNFIGAVFDLELYAANVVGDVLIGDEPIKRFRQHQMCQGAVSKVE